jgi:alkylation response protein AidB-like acyl-CoA dehydrogenase
MGMLLARTNPEVPKHQGITYFAFDMRQPGVEVRPLREMTGRALFNEVFITEARVPNDAIIGGLNNGWAVANTTLAFERAGLGAGGGAAAGGAALPGSLAGDLDKRAGDLVRSRTRGGAGGPGGMSGTSALLQALARDLGVTGDPLVRQGLARLYTLTEIGRYMALRQKAAKSTGGDVPGAGNLAKLSMSNILRQSRDLGLQMLGARGTLHAYASDGNQALGGLRGGTLATMVTDMSLFTQGPPIYGGTDEIQHNIIGERVLGLPKEPNKDKVTPFKDLPRN